MPFLSAGCSIPFRGRRCTVAPLRSWILRRFAPALVGAAPAWGQTDDDPPIFTVTGTARTFTASTSEFEHWVAIARRDGAARKAARAAAFQLLIRYAWASAEADLRGVAVSGDEVEAELWSQVDETFPSRRAFRRWLRRAGQTMLTSACASGWTCSAPG